MVFLLYTYFLSCLFSLVPPDDKEGNKGKKVEVESIGNIVIEVYIQCAGGHIGCYIPRDKGGYNHSGIFYIQRKLIPAMGGL